MTVVGFAQSIISGKVTDAVTKEPILGASVSIKGTVLGGVADGSGKFSIKSKQSFPVTVSVGAIGFLTELVEVKDESSLSISLKENIGTLAEVTVTGNRVEESLTKASTTIENSTSARLHNQLRRMFMVSYKG